MLSVDDLPFEGSTTLGRKHRTSMKRPSHCSALGEILFWRSGNRAHNPWHDAAECLVTLTTRLRSPNFSKDSIKNEHQQFFFFFKKFMIFSWDFTRNLSRDSAWKSNQGFQHNYHNKFSLVFHQDFFRDSIRHSSRNSAVSFMKSSTRNPFKDYIWNSLRDATTSFSRNLKSRFLEIFDLNSQRFYQKLNQFFCLNLLL